MAKDVVKVGKSAAKEVAQRAVMHFEKMKTELTELNEGVELDFLNLGSWLYINKKGQFYDKDSGEIFKDSIRVVILGGAAAFVAWSDDSKPVVREKTKEAAEAKLYEYNEENGTQLTLDERYVLSIVLEDNVERLYVLSLPITGKYAFGKYTVGLYQGVYPGVTEKSIKNLITEIYTETAGSGQRTYNAVKFKPAE